MLYLHRRLRNDIDVLEEEEVRREEVELEDSISERLQGMEREYEEGEEGELEGGKDERLTLRRDGNQVLTEEVEEDEVNVRIGRGDENKLLEVGEYWEGERQAEKGGEKYYKVLVEKVTKDEEGEKQTGKELEDEVEEDEYEITSSFQGNPSYSSRENSFPSYLQVLDYYMVGNRICHLGYVLTETLRKASEENNHRPNCISGTWKFLDCFKRGFKTKVYLKCDECNEIISIDSHPDDYNNLDVNRSMVLGCMAAGIGYSTLEQVMAAVGISCMNSSTYRYIQEEIVLDALGISKECMEKSLEKEVAIAMKKGRAINGVPYITVITDGSWAKRSFGKSFNSLGGCAVILGYETGEILDVIVRCKACSKCDTAEREGRRKTLKKKTPVIYRYLIADGDSSVLKNILIHDPYREYGVRVKKIECTNHLLRNFVNKLEKIGKKKGENEVTGDSSLMALNLVKDNTLKLRMEIQAAVERRRADTSVPIENSISLLMKDIWNVPSHIFGEHKICSQLDWPCDRNGIDESEVNNVPLLEATGIYSKVMKVVKDLSANAESLLFNTTNNLAECFNNIICKAISGKRINYTMRGPYTGRCAIASIQFTTKGALSTLYKGMNKHIPEEVTKMESE